MRKLVNFGSIRRRWLGDRGLGKVVVSSITITEVLS